ncbi:MAG: isoprenylcysteine carboxylmethyltransferase family protein [Spirochaetales bacterium]|nr:isoprenylcysteine carboxylmethyltransferase family protein [Spirochaetales bacterium]
MSPWKMTKKDTLWTILLTVLGIACFPVNPLVLTHLVEPGYNRIAYIIGWPVWAVGMILVMAPIIAFPRRGGVKKGTSFVHTTRLVDSGIYGLVRHPQYLGGILALFVTTALWYPHWLFFVLGGLGSAAVYFSCREEDKEMVRKFGDDYRDYMRRVPRVNILAGILRAIRR